MVVKSKDLIFNGHTCIILRRAKINSLFDGEKICTNCPLDKCLLETNFRQLFHI